MKKTLATLMAIVLLLAMVPVVVAQAPVELDVISFMGEETKRNGFDAVVEAYQKEHPEVTFNVQHLDYGSFTTTLQTRIAANDAPDLIFGTAILNQELVKSGQIEVLNDHPILDKYHEEDLACMTIEGNTYGVSLDKMVICTFYNKDMFAARGLQAPTTLDELYHVIEVFEAEGIIPFVRPYKDAAYVQYDLDTQLYPLIDQTKNYAFFTDLEEGKTSFLDSTEMRTALELFAKRIGYLSGDDLGTDPTVATEMFASGQSPMLIQGSWIIGDVLNSNPNGNFGVFATPISNVPEENTMYAAVDDAWMVSSTSEHKEVALDFLDFMTSDEGLGIWANTVKTIPIRAVEVDGMPQVLTDIARLLDSGIGVNVDAYVYFSSEATDRFNQAMQLFVSDPDVDNMLTILEDEFSYLRY